MFCVQWLKVKGREGRMVNQTLWGIILVALAMIGGLAEGLDNGLARLPPIGWMSGERFGCQTDCDNYPNDCIR